MDDEHVDKALVPVHGARQRARMRGQRALELRLAGLAFRRIAEALNYQSRTGAHNAVSRCLKRNDAQNVQQYHDLTLARCERMIATLWPRVLRGDLYAVDRVLRIMDRQIRILGLEAPVQVGITGPTKDRLADMIADVERLILPLDPDPAG